MTQTKFFVLIDQQKLICYNQPRSLLMQNKQVINKDGKILEALMGGMFRIELDDSSVVIASISGKMRKSRIRVLPGDRVRMEFSPHDLSRGRIVYRL